MHESPEKLRNEQSEDQLRKSLKDSTAEMTFLKKLIEKFLGEEWKGISRKIGEADRMLLEIENVLDRSDRSTRAVLYPSIKRGCLDDAADKLTALRRKKEEIRAAVLSALP